jgi:hypothetical protein
LKSGLGSGASGLKLRASLSSTVSLSKGIKNTHHFINNRGGGGAGNNGTGATIMNSKNATDTQLIQQQTVKQQLQENHLTNTPS